MNPNDQIREQMLTYFYNRNSNATSRMGKKGSAVKISDARRELKDQFALKQQQVLSNLTYLVDNAWVKTVEVNKTINVRGNAIPQTTTFYEITANGIDKIEGGSQFEPKDRYAGINISASGTNIITLGDGNVVNAKYSDLHSALDLLKVIITKSESIAESEKFDLAVDLESIKDQLAKSEPNQNIVSELWTGVQRISSIVGLTPAFIKASELIALLLD